MNDNRISSMDPGNTADATNPALSACPANTPNQPMPAAGNPLIPAPGNPGDRKSKKSQRGMALLMVVWMVVLLTAISAEYSMTMRTDLLVTESIKEEAEAYYMAIAGYNAAMAELMQPIATQYTDENGNMAFSSVQLNADSSGEGVLSPGVERNASLDTGSYSYKIGDEQGKFPISNLNSPVGSSGMLASDAFKEILMQSGVQDEVQAATIVDSLIDWTDAGDEHQLNGAEDDWYERHYQEQGMSFPYKTPDLNRLNVVEELLLVRGMTPEILYGSAAIHTASMVGAESPPAGNAEGAYQGIFDSISVFSRGQPPNRLTANPMAIAVYYPDEYDQIMTQRESGLPIPGSPPSRIFSIVATGRSLSGRTQHSVRAVVTRAASGGSTARLIVSQWNDNYLNENIAAPAPATE